MFNSKDLKIKSEKGTREGLGKYEGMMSTVEEKKFTYYQFRSELGLPVFIKVDSGSFTESFPAFLKEMGFTPLEESKALSALKDESKGRVLHITEASPIVASQISTPSESDRFGQERITPANGYRIYRYKGFALMIYSFAFSEWQLGVFPNFGAEGSELACRSVINRFLSWALSPLGIVGFWGVSFDDGIVIFRQGVSQGEAVYLDVIKKLLISVEGVRKMPTRLQILRLDPSLHGRNIKMSSEELLGFLSTSCTYFDYESFSVPVRQMIQAVSKQAEGLIYPKESFRPRTDLSL